LSRCGAPTLPATQEVLPESAVSVDLRLELFFPPTPPAGLAPCDPVSKPFETKKATPRPSFPSSISFPTFWHTCLLLPEPLRSFFLRIVWSRWAPPAGAFFENFAEGSCFPFSTLTTWPPSSPLSRTEKVLKCPVGSERSTQTVLPPLSFFYNLPVVLDHLVWLFPPSGVRVDPLFPPSLQYCSRNGLPSPPVESFNNRRPPAFSSLSTPPPALSATLPDDRVPP